MTLQKTGDSCSKVCGVPVAMELRGGHSNEIGDRGLVPGSSRRQSQRNLGLSGWFPGMPPQQGFFQIHRRSTGHRRQEV